MSDEEGMQASYGAMVSSLTKQIAMLRAIHAASVQNLEAFVQDAAENIREIEKVIARKGKELYHIQSMQLGRNPPAPTPEEAQAVAKVERDEEQIKLEKEFKKGKPAPGFPVEVPPDAKIGPLGATWSHEMPAEASAGDEIDEQGRRHIRARGRHQIWSQQGKLISDEVDQEAQAIFDQLLKAGYIDEKGEPTEAGKAAMKKKSEGSPESSNGASS